MCTKLRRGTRHAAPHESIGGSTYHFDIWDGHPLEVEVLGLLSELRGRSLELCERVQTQNAALASELPATLKRVTAYVGQTVIEEEEDADDEQA
jgi:hypothetical protein